MASATTCDHVEQGLTKVWQAGLIAGVGASFVWLVFFWIAKGVFNIPYIFSMGGPSGP